MKLPLQFLTVAGRFTVALLPVLFVQNLITFAESRLHRIRPMRTFDHKRSIRYEHMDVFGHPAYRMRRMMKRYGDGPVDHPPPINLPGLDGQEIEDNVNTIINSTPGSLKNNSTNNGMRNGPHNGTFSIFTIFLPFLVTLFFIHHLRL